MRYFSQIGEISKTSPSSMPSISNKAVKSNASVKLKADDIDKQVLHGANGCPHNLLLVSEEIVSHKF